MTIELCYWFSGPSGNSAVRAVGDHQSLSKFFLGVSGNTDSGLICQKITRAEFDALPGDVRSVSLNADQYYFKFMGNQ